jgi:hypothetical protein
MQKLILELFGMNGFYLIGEVSGACLTGNRRSIVRNVIATIIRSWNVVIIKQIDVEIAIDVFC